MNVPKVGVCYCGCGDETGGHFAPGHDGRAASMLEFLHGHSDTAERVLQRGYGPGRENLKAKARAAGWKSRAET
jgi:hypothetical protein